MEDRLFVNILEFQKEGIDWLILTAIPESLFLPTVMENMRLALMLGIIAVMLSILIFFKVIKSYLKPIDSLIETTAQFSQGDLTKRVHIMRNDEMEEFRGHLMRWQILCRHFLILWKFR